MKIEVGKKYVNRKGEIVEITGENNYGSYKFYSREGYTLEPDGVFLLGTPSVYDLISEYTEPAQKNNASEIESLLSHIQYFPEINMNNYSEGQVRELNDWGIATFLAASAMQSASHEPVSESSGQYQTITTQVTVAPTGEPIFSENAIHVGIDYIGDRQFMRVMRGRSEDAVIIKPKEWPAIRDAIDAMVASAEKLGEKGDKD